MSNSNAYLFCVLVDLQEALKDAEDTPIDVYIKNIYIRPLRRYVEKEIKKRSGKPCDGG